MAKRAAILSIMIVATLLAWPAAAITKVPPGNRSAEQPSVPSGSANRTRANATTYEAKYRRVYALLRNDPQLLAKIKAVSAQYGIDPMHVIGAIVGEHTYNVDVYDRLQTYYVKAVAYLSSGLSFSHNGESIAQFVRRPQMEGCDKLSDSYEIWSCRERIWNAVFRGKTVDGAAFPNDRFGAVFFQPFYAGQTFGIGQLNPLTALQMSDLVNRISGYPKLSEEQPAQIYKTIMDPDLTLAYVAATLKTAIDAYRSIAGFDISGNPGVTSTLYNVGNPEERARALRAENRRRAAAGEAPRLPQENYYGWLVNDRLDELRKLL
ncbi:MAG TPA: DUF1402 family protein [Rhizobiaceae bacterium]|nr:DUF1402 family protein [Rhizobiaceae bacterium]